MQAQACTTARIPFVDDIIRKGNAILDGTMRPSMVGALSSPLPMYPSESPKGVWSLAVFHLPYLYMSAH